MPILVDFKVPGVQLDCADNTALPLQHEKVAVVKIEHIVDDCHRGCQRLLRLSTVFDVLLTGYQLPRFVTNESLGAYFEFERLKDTGRSVLLDGTI